MKQATRISIVAGAGVLSLAVGSVLMSSARPSKMSASKASASRAAKKATSNTRLAALPRGARKPLPRYLPLNELNLWREANSNFQPRPTLTPFKNGKPLSPTKVALPGAAPVDRATLANPQRLAQLPRAARPATRGTTRRPAARRPAFPRSVAPAPIRRAARPATPVEPRWVRYPLEFQLAGIGLGSRAVDKDRFNRIDRYGLFAMHGNPTAVVVPVVSAGGGAGGGAAGGGAPGGAGAGGATAAPTVSNLTVNQTPPQNNYDTLFPTSQNGGLPDWASAVTVDLDNNHVQWLYNRETYAMGFVVDRLGFVDAIVVAGIESPITRTQLEDPVHTVKLGDDTRKVMFRYGYPDTIETYPINLIAGAGVAANGGANGAAAGAGAPAGGAPGGAAGAAETGNGAFRTFEMRYEQSYNVVFTIRNNRVARIYIFGDPDFFTDSRRQNLRRSY